VRALYWAGCTFRLRLPEVVEDHLGLLSELGVDVVELSEEGCCGDPLRLSGLAEGFRLNAVKVAERIGALDVDALITGCAGCYRSFKDYAELKLGIPRVLHLAHVAADLMPKLSGEGAERVAYHDPCELGRLSGVYEEPRRALAKVAEVVEPLTSRGEAMCCGGGGGLWSTAPELSLAVAEARLARDVEPLGVSKLATACPACLLNLRIAAARREASTGRRLEVVDLGSYLLHKLRVGR
jgi:Fe-S oxidoreductase